MTRQRKANELRTDLLAALDEARSRMNSWRFLKALKSAGEDDRADAARLILDVAFARQTLAAAILGDIVDELEAEAKEIEQAIESLDDAVQHLNKVKSVLNAVAKVIEVVGRIVSLV